MNIRLNPQFVQRCASLACVIAVVCIGIAVIIYGTYGGQWLDALDDTIGEIAAQRADSLAENGLFDEAIVQYRKALDLEFDDPGQREWVAGRFLALLMRDKKYAEAVEVARATLSRLPSISIHEKLVGSLRMLGDDDEVVGAAREWGEMAAESDNAYSYSLAKFNEGWALSNLDRQDEALDAFLAGFEVHKLPENGRAAAQILIRQHRIQEAKPLLDTVIESGHPVESEIARRLRAELTNGSLAH